MLDTDTFLTELYVMCDDFCKARPAPPPSPGPRPSLSRGEVLTLCIFGQWRHFASERDFYRFDMRHLRSHFPSLPDRPQFNRLQRACYSDLVAFWQQLTSSLRPEEVQGYYEAMDATAVAIRHASRRGNGWLSAQTDKGLASRLGWYRGFYLLATTDPSGVFTGWGIGTASCKDQPLAEAFLRARAFPDARLPTVGQALPEDGYYLTDSGFQGKELHLHWLCDYQAEVITAPQRVGGPGKSRGISRGGRCAIGSLHCARSSKPPLASFITFFACVTNGLTAWKAS